MQPLEQVEQIEREARDGLSSAPDEDALEVWRTATLGRSGTLTTILRSLGALDPEVRRELGRAANKLKSELEAALEQRRRELRGTQLNSESASNVLDVTLPGRPRRRGKLHPVTLTMREILSAFERMGFSTIEGPEVELEEYNFERLRIPEDHPARDMWDTFWLEPSPSSKPQERRL